MLDAYDMNCMIPMAICKGERERPIVVFSILSSYYYGCVC